MRTKERARADRAAGPGSTAGPAEARRGLPGAATFAPNFAGLPRHTRTPRPANSPGSRETHPPALGASGHGQPRGGGARLGLRPRRAAARARSPLARPYSPRLARADARELEPPSPPFPPPSSSARPASRFQSLPPQPPRTLARGGRGGAWGKGGPGEQEAPARAHCRARQLCAHPPRGAGPAPDTNRAESSAEVPEGPVEFGAPLPGRRTGRRHGGARLPREGGPPLSARRRHTRDGGAAGARLREVDGAGTPLLEPELALHVRSCRVAPKAPSLHGAAGSVARFVVVVVKKNVATLHSLLTPSRAPARVLSGSGSPGGTWRCTRSQGHVAKAWFRPGVRAAGVAVLRGPANSLGVR